MNRLALLLVAGSCLGFARAQSNTVPKGFDAQDGGSAVYDAWRPIGAVATTYIPARVVYLYDKSLFSWDATKPKVFSRLSVRRDQRTPTGDATAHVKDMALILSTSSQPSHAPDRCFDNNLGNNRRMVMPRRQINFPKTPQPTTGPAPFNVSLTLRTPFVVPANSKTLVIEVRSYSGRVNTGDWIVDGHTYPTGGNHGSGSAKGFTSHCVEDPMYYSRQSSWPGACFLHLWDHSATNNIKPGVPVVAWIGVPFPAGGIKLPGTGNASKNIPGCEWYVQMFALTATLTKPDARRSMFLNFGRLPNDRKWVGATFWHQAARFSANNALGIGLTRAFEETLGSGYDPTNVPATSVYSSGSTRNRRYDGKPTDPDNEPVARYYYRRVAIFELK